MGAVAVPTLPALHVWNENTARSLGGTKKLHAGRKEGCNYLDQALKCICISVAAFF